MAEIEALQKCAENGCEFIVEILWEGTIKVEEKEFPYYVMEKAQSDLKSTFSVTLKSIIRRV
ncbi:MAG: hypothetical protein IPL77_12315 [Flavobacteriales bacterium]|nr:hypothetical protein [Flavobacteriales bacterium]